jgi:hypothetical protein
MLNSILKNERLALILTVFVLIFWSSTYYIHSSEFWSIYISKFTFDTTFAHTIKMKPLFHFFLYLFHLPKISDTAHLWSVKLFFSFIGAVQFALLWLIFKRYILFSVQQKFLNSLFILFTVFIFLSEIYLKNFFRVRSDQLCITLFLIYIYLNSNFKLSTWMHFLFIAAYPLIAIKGVLFSILHIPLFISHLKNTPVKSKYLCLYFLTLLALLITAVNNSWTGVVYLLNVYDNAANESLFFFYSWLKSDALLISMTIISIFHRKYQITVKNYLNLNLYPISILSFAIIILFPQKHGYFIASFMPVFFLNSLTYIFYLIWRFLNTDYFSNIDIKNRKYFIYAVTAIYIMIQGYPYLKNSPYRSNLSQLRFVSHASEFIKRYNLSFIDGIGALPRSKNMNCFVSPSDDIANHFCTLLVQKGTPDIVILTSRLMWLIGPNDIIDKKYNHLGKNIFIRKNLDLNWPVPDDIGPALLTFGLEN